MAVFNNKEFIEKLKWLVNDVPNFYYSKNGTWCNYDTAKQKFMMDCVVSIKGLLWGFKADKNRSHGGAAYLSNGVVDFGANAGINYCNNASQDFSNLIPGEYLCMKGTNYGHAGIYLGNGKVFECTTGWGANKCIISDIDNQGNRSYNGVKNLKWTWHGKLKYIDYVTETKQIIAYPGTLIRKGSKGDNVRKVQAKLIELGYSCGKWGTDGIFGNDTLSAVKAFQKANGLAVDGIVGPLTWAKLFN